MPPKTMNRALVRAASLVRKVYLCWAVLAIICIVAIPLFAMLPCAAPCHGGPPWIPFVLLTFLGAPVQMIADWLTVEPIYVGIAASVLAIILWGWPRIVSSRQARAAD